MNKPFAITAASPRVRLDEDGTGHVRFAVTNASGKPLTAVATISVEAPGQNEWVRVAGSASRPFEAHGFQSFLVEIAVPPEARQGTYVLRLLIADEENPHDRYAVSPRVSFGVALEPQAEELEHRPFPWWIVAAGGAVAVVLVGAAWIWATLRPVPPTAAFSASITKGPAPLQVVFTDASTAAKHWAWDFGDGAIATNQNPTHTYTRAGSYLVRLEVRNHGGEDAATRRVVVQSSQLRVSVQATPTTGPAPLRVTLSGTVAKGTATAYSWDLGDGGTAQTQTVDHTYPFPGPYTPKLTVQDEYGNPVTGSADISVTAPARSCAYTAWVSEEQGERDCPSGAAVAGMRCRGNDCDAKQLYCCRYAAGADDRANPKWAAYTISDETDGGHHSEVTDAGVLGGIRCKGIACDDVGTLWLHPDGVDVNHAVCGWTGWFSEHGGAGTCSGDMFASGVRCKGSHCGQLALQCCPIRYTGRH